MMSYYDYYSKFNLNKILKLAKDKIEDIRNLEANAIKGISWTTKSAMFSFDHRQQYFNIYFE